MRFSRARAHSGSSIVGVHSTVRTDQMGKDRGIIAAARPNLHHGLGLLDFAGSQPIGVSARLADIDPSLAIQREEQVLIEECRIIVGRLHVWVGAEVQPGDGIS